MRRSAVLSGLDPVPRSAIQEDRVSGRHAPPWIRPLGAGPSRVILSCRRRAGAAADTLGTVSTRASRPTRALAIAGAAVLAGVLVVGFLPSRVDGGVEPAVRRVLAWLQG